jgi:hypothetical protein
MQQQIEGFILNLNHELSKRATTKPKEEDLSLMPVIHIGALSRTENKKSDSKRKTFRG